MQKAVIQLNKRTEYRLQGQTETVVVTSEKSDLFEVGKTYEVRFYQSDEFPIYQLNRR